MATIHLTPDDLGALIAAGAAPAASTACEIKDGALVVILKGLAVGSFPRFDAAVEVRLQPFDASVGVLTLDLALARAFKLPLAWAGPLVVRAVLDRAAAHLGPQEWLRVDPPGQRLHVDLGRLVARLPVLGRTHRVTGVAIEDSGLRIGLGPVATP